MGVDFAFKPACSLANLAILSLTDKIQEILTLIFFSRAFQLEVQIVRRLLRWGELLGLLVLQLIFGRAAVVGIKHGFLVVHLVDQLTERATVDR